MIKSILFVGKTKRFISVLLVISLCLCMVLFALTGEARAQDYAESFTSTDGAVTYTVDLDEPEVPSSVPVLEAAEHTITPEDAEALGLAVFGDADVYNERNTTTKSQLDALIASAQEEIQYWEDYAADGGDADRAESMISGYEMMLSTYENMYENAPETDEPRLADWQFDDELWVSCQINDEYFYYFYALNQDDENFRLHEMRMYRYTVGDNYIYHADTESPEEAIENALSMSAQILEAMGKEDWLLEAQISSNNVIGTNDINYTLQVTATPVYGGIPLAPQGELGDPTMSGGFAYESLTMTFKENMLASLVYVGAMETVDVLEEDTDILSFDAVLESLQEALSARGASSYRNAADVSVDVTRAELTMARIPTEDDDMVFELVPAYTFYGEVSGTGSSAEPAGGSAEPEGSGSGESVLIILNALDGSVISST